MTFPETSIPRQPSRSREVGCVVVRELSAEDVAALAAGERAPAKSRITKLRESHHQLARVLATGLTNIEASIATGYDPGYISILRSDPTFQELLSAYSGEVKLASVQEADGLRVLHKSARALMQERLDEKPESVTDETLIDLIKSTADRIGLGPKSTVDVKVDIGDRLEAARKRAGLALGPPATGGDTSCKTIEGHVESRSVVPFPALGRERSAVLSPSPEEPVA